MNLVEPSYAATDAIWAGMRPLLDRLLAQPRSPRSSRTVPAVPGIYLFSDGKRYRYVGQTRNLRERLGQHTRPSGTHTSATVAFLLALEEATIAGPSVRQTRAIRQVDPRFEPLFARAKATVAGWDVQYVEVADPNVRTVFEVYAHLALRTDLNSFETH